MFQDRLSASGWDAGRDTSRSPYVVTPRIKKDESQRGAAETDGRTDTYVQETSGGPTPGCRSNAIRNWREGASASVSERERERQQCVAKSIWTTLVNTVLCRFGEEVHFSRFKLHRADRVNFQNKKRPYLQ